MSWKVNEKGEYVKFQGLTVVSSAINCENDQFWQELHDELSSLSIVTEHFALLPYKSYHMTTLNLEVQHHRTDEQWQTHINGRISWFRDLHTRLQRDTLRPRVIIDRISVQGTIMIFLRLDPEQDTSIHQIAGDFNIGYAVQSVYHITLAYQFANMAEHVKPEVFAALDAILQRIIHRKMELEPPKLCYFNDMTAFIPWDAQTNPFQV